MKFIQICFLLSFICLFNGCLYTSHNFNTGRILKQGHSGLSIGVGNSKFQYLDCPDYAGHQSGSFQVEEWSELIRDDDGKARCRTITVRSNQSIDSTESDTAFSSPGQDIEKTLQLSLGYRLGIRDQWGPFPGLEFGFLFELPTMPISSDFYLKLALPDQMWKKIKHAVSVGYIMGAWTDNSYYLEYALSGEVGKHLLYANTRSIWLATQLAVLEETGDNLKLPHDRVFVQQFSLGFLWNIPDIVVFPDYVTPQLSAVIPVVPATMDKVVLQGLDDWFDVKLNVGMGWNF